MSQLGEEMKNRRETFQQLKIMALAHKQSLPRFSERRVQCESNLAVLRVTLEPLRDQANAWASAVSNAALQVTLADIRIMKSWMNPPLAAALLMESLSILFSSRSLESLLMKPERVVELVQNFQISNSRAALAFLQFAQEKKSVLNKPRLMGISNEVVGLGKWTMLVVDALTVGAVQLPQLELKIKEAGETASRARLQEADAIAALGQYKSKLANQKEEYEKFQQEMQHLQSQHSAATVAAVAAGWLAEL